MYRVVVGVFVLAACGGGGSKAGDDAQPPLPQTGCGDGVASGGEMCDGTDLRGRTDCRDLGYYDAAPLACTATCELDTSQCTGSCGDGVVQTDHEFCDGADPSATCTDYGFGAGALTCDRCGPDFGDCQFFGWHRDYLPFAPAAIAGTSDHDVWAVGDSTAHWDGATWQPFTFPGACAVPDRSFGAVAPVAADDVWFGGGETIIHLTGGTCTKYFLGNPNSIQASNLVALADNDVWLQGYNTVWHFDGQTWTTYDVSLETMWVTGHDDVWGVDGSSIVHHFDGTSWTTMALDPQRWLSTIWGTGPHDIYAGGQNVATSSPFDRSVIEHYDGATWTEITLHEPIEQNDGVTSIAGVAGHVFIGLHNTNAVRVLETNGFVTLATPELRAQTQIVAFPSGHLFVVPKGFPQVFRFDGTEQFDLSLGQPSSVAPVSATEMYAVVPQSPGGTRLYNFDGSFWRQDTSLSFVRSVTTALSGDVLVLASDGLHTRTGATWSAPTQGMTDGELLWAASPTDVWIRDSATHYLHHWDGATDSVCATCSIPARQLWGSSSTDIYELDENYGFEHWDGTTWSDASQPPTFHPTVLFGWAANDIAAFDGGGQFWHYDGTAWNQLAFPYPNLRPRYLWGTSLHDLFAANDATVFHYDGARWSPVKIPTAYWLTGITGAGDLILVTDHSGPAHHLVRTHPWH